jgi:hypothetical protein
MTLVKEFRVITNDASLEHESAPAVLADYHDNYELPDNWTLLRGSPDDALELAARCSA